MEERSKGAGLAQVRRAHLVGIAGSGLCGMAQLFASRGVQVTGSETLDSGTLDRLRQGGILCTVGQAEGNVPEEVDLVVVSAAVGDDNPEVLCARRRGIPVLKYARCLGALMSERRGIAVAGTHGKTTTTAMVAWTLARAGRDPGFLIGGDYPGLGGSSRWGRGELFVAEACEFDRSFLNLDPACAIVTNIEEDHLDYFRSLAEIEEAFADFVRRLPADGRLVLNADDPRSMRLRDRSPAPASLFSLTAGAGDFWAEDVHPAGGGGGILFRARSAEGESRVLKLRVPGVHNVRNALACLTLLRHLGLDLEEVARGLEEFAGVRRRFEVLRGEPVAVIDDYAHHPTEIEAVVRAARESFAGRRLRLVFQPHQHSRMRRFLGEFARTLAAADEAVVTEVFQARDTAEEVRAVSAAALVAEVERRGGRAVWAPAFSDVLEHLRRTLRAGDALVCLGAGDITLLARRIADGLVPALFAGIPPEEGVA